MTDERRRVTGRWRIFRRSVCRLHSKTCGGAGCSDAVLRSRSILRQPGRHSGRPGVRSGRQRGGASTTVGAPATAASVPGPGDVVGGVTAARSAGGDRRATRATSTVRAIVARRSDGTLRLRPDLLADNQISLGRKALYWYPFTPHISTWHLVVGIQFSIPILVHPISCHWLVSQHYPSLICFFFLTASRKHSCFDSYCKRGRPSRLTYLSTDLTGAIIHGCTAGCGGRVLHNCLVSDLFFCLVGIPAALLSIPGVGGRLSYLYGVCRVPLHNLFLFSSTWIAALVAAERFFVVVRPLRARMCLKVGN